MLRPQSARIIKFKWKAPQWPCLNTRARDFRSLHSDVLDDTWSQGEALLATLVRVFLDQAIAKTDARLRIIPIDELFRLVSRKGQALGTAAVIVHSIDTLC